MVCSKNQIFVKGYTRSGYDRCPRGMGGICKSNEKIHVKEIHVKGHCVEDTGEKGKTPKSKRWAPKELKGKNLGGFMPGGKMPFNRSLKDQFNACESAGKALRKDDISFKSSMGKVLFAYNMNKRLYKNGAPQWDHQRESCLKGIRKAFDR